MRVIIDCSSGKNYNTSAHAFMEALWMQLAIQKPDDSFLFLNKVIKVKNGIAGENVVFEKYRKSRLGWMQRRKISKILNQFKADRLVTLHIDRCNVYGYRENKAHKIDILQAQKTILFAAPLAAAGTNTIQINPAEIHLLPISNTQMEPLSWAAAESIKTQYTGGRDYFLFTGDISEQHALIALLKAFSIFKKWQQSNMQLVIAGFETAWTDELEDKLLNFKYREDVVVLKNLPLEEITRLTAAAYAVVYPSLEPVLPLALVQALQLAVPCIASALPSYQALPLAAIWVDNSETVEGFSSAMILLYKDEQERNALIEKARQAASLLNREAILASIWELLQA